VNVPKATPPLTPAITTSTTSTTTTTNPIPVTSTYTLATYTITTTPATSTTTFTASTASPTAELERKEARRRGREEKRKTTKENEAANECNGPCHNLAQMQEAYEIVFGAHAVRGQEVDMKEKTIIAAYRKLARTQHPDKGGSADAFGKLEAAKDTLIYISKYSLRRYHYSEMAWATVQLGYALTSKCLPRVLTAVEVNSSYDTKMSDLAGMSTAEKAKGQYILALARDVMLDIAAAGVWKVVTNPFDPLQCFPRGGFLWEGDVPE